LNKASFNKEFLDMMSYAIDALWYIDITVDKDAFLTLPYRLYEIPCKYSIFALITNVFLFR